MNASNEIKASNKTNQNVEEALLKFHDVHLQFPYVENPILSSINFTVKPGDCILLLGSNGSGKSSIMKLIQQKYFPTQGKIEFQKKSYESMNSQELSRSLISVNQELSTSLFYGLTVLENCLVWESRSSTSMFSLECRQKKSFYRDYLKAYHPSLSLKLDTSLRFLSGGEKQALLLALCLHSPPNLLLLDEHTSALDPIQSNSIMETTHQALMDHGITCIISTHNVDHALRYGNRLIALQQGKIIFEAEEESKQSLSKHDLLTLCYPS